MGNLTSTLTFKVVDDATKPARSIGQALAENEKRIQAIAKAMSNTGATDKFTASLGKLKLSAKDIETVSAAWKNYSASAKLAGNATAWTKEQAAGVRRWESQTISALRAVEREQAKFERASRKRGGAGGGHGDMSGRQIAMGIAGGYIAHSTTHFAKESLDVYREFDKERRYAKAVMAINDDDQKPLIDQAIHGGATSKFNDIQWLEAQRELAARGLNSQQVLGITPIAARLGQAMDKTLPEASKLLEGGMFGFGKDISTFEKARANAARTADLQVKAAKISGMNAEDVQQAYKYGAAPFRMAGLSEEQLLAFSAVGKKANMGGDEMGVAARAMSAALLKPTAGARTAMLANGIDFSKYQKLGARPMDIEPFAQSIAGTYGVQLGEAAKKKLKAVFDDPKLVQDSGKFMPAVMKVLGDSLGGDDAKSKKSIAGEARRYRDAAMSGVDAQGLFRAMIPAIASNPALANLIFGSKQGARIRTAIGDPDVFLHKLDELEHHSDGYAQNISDQRMAGFDGAVSRFEGAVMNLKSALPRAFDNDGKGGLLTGVTDKIGNFVQALAEAPPSLQRLGATAGVAAAAFAGFKGAEALLGGFGLKGSAVALTGAAEALTAAAGKQAMASGLSGIPGGDKGAKKGLLSKLGSVAKGVAVVGTALEVAEVVTDHLNENPEALKPADTAIHKYIPQLPASAGPRTVGDDLGLPGLDEPSGTERPQAFGPSPFGDLSGVGHLKQQAVDTKAALDSVNGTTVSPVVDGASLDAALAKANALASVLRSLGGLAQGVGSSVNGIKVPSLGATQRGNFTFGGVKGE